MLQKFFSCILESKLLVFHFAHLLKSTLRYKWGTSMVCILYVYVPIAIHHCFIRARHNMTKMSDTNLSLVGQNKTTFNIFFCCNDIFSIFFQKLSIDLFWLSSYQFNSMGSSTERASVSFGEILECKILLAF